MYSAISSSSPTTKKFTIMDIVEMVRGASTPEQLEYLMKEIIQAGPTSGNERAKRLEAVKLAHHLAMRWMESLSTATEKIMAAKRLLSSDGGDDGDDDDDDDDDDDGGVHDEERRVTFDPATPLNRTPSPRLDDTPHPNNISAESDVSVITIDDTPSPIYECSASDKSADMSAADMDPDLSL